jgi:orotidine-5'-phosphate decarboxylase
MSSSPFLNPLVVALDVDTAAEALRIATLLEGLAGGFKLGPRLCLRYGNSLIQQVAQHGPVFLDNKHFDIPSTMEAAIRASFEAGSSAVTVHALSGREALIKMAELEAQLSKNRPFKIFAVTILTSWSQDSIPINMKSQKLESHVFELAQLAKNCGLSSLVCSVHELAALKSLGLFTLTPGIRFNLGPDADQKRVATPHQARQAGSSAIVIGRPILESADPALMARQILMNFHKG